MKKNALFGLPAVILATVSLQASAETLAEYVSTCKTELGFQNSPIPDLDCNAGVLFAPNGGAPDETNDFFLYRKINHAVDVTVACRWMKNGHSSSNGTYPPPFPIARSIEMLVHNRATGGTCFFTGKEHDIPLYNATFGTIDIHRSSVSTAIVSPTSANAEDYWKSPTELDAHVPCVDCHVAGPYIASERIAPFMSQFGLIADGHDTFARRYHSVGDTFRHFNDIVAATNATNNCASLCHSLGSGSNTPDVVVDSFVLLPSISTVINEVQRTAGVMPPYDDGSNYRWINLDTPVDGVEAESFRAANDATSTLVPQLFSKDNPNCAQPNVPNVMEAHVVGSDNTFVVVQPGRFAFLADRLSVFNLEQGLVCLNSDQDPGQKCQDYRVRYECADEAGVKTWSNFSSRALSSDGDHEERPANVCAMGSKAIGIEAAYTHRTNDWTYSSIGPNDRLASFSQYGLSCNNAEQPDGECSNYVVRYSSCGAPPEKANRTLTNVFAVGKVLTAASNSLTKGQARNGSWNTQQWAIEPLKNTEYVRLRNTGNNVYLTVASASESATVGTAASNSSTNQLWLVEPVSGSTDIRLKNVYSGKYLTMADPKSFTSTPNYLPVFSQTRNTSWTSQRWVIQ